MFVPTVDGSLAPPAAPEAKKGSDKVPVVVVGVVIGVVACPPSPVPTPTVPTPLVTGGVVTTGSGILGICPE